jgi:amino acid permease
MRSINESRMYAAAAMATASDDGSVPPPPSAPSSYVELAEVALGGPASRAVFALTLAASLGVCSTYIAFVGGTMASLSSDPDSTGVVRSLAPDVGEQAWSAAAAAIVLPLSSIRNYGAFAFTSALGVFAVLGGMIVTLAYGIFVDPGGGVEAAVSAASHSRMWPISYRDAFGGSFGTIAYLFCVNFLTFPIINSMRDAGEDYDDAVSAAVAVIWIVNVVFAVLCLGFYGDDTQDLILRNLGNGPYLSALKLLLCVDLLFTFPVVFSSGRQILENALLPNGGNPNNNAAKDDGGQTTQSVALARAAITTGAMAACLGLSRLGGFGVVANLVGGVAQGTLAFVLPPAISIALSRRGREGAGFAIDEVPQWLVGGFGVAVVVSVTYFTLTESLG